VKLAASKKEFEDCVSDLIDIYDEMAAARAGVLTLQQKNVNAKTELRQLRMMLLREELGPDDPRLRQVTEIENEIKTTNLEIEELMACLDQLQPRLLQALSVYPDLSLEGAFDSVTGREKPLSSLSLSNFVGGLTDILLSDSTKKSPKHSVQIVRMMKAICTACPMQTAALIPHLSPAFAMVWTDVISSRWHPNQSRSPRYEFSALIQNDCTLHTIRVKACPQEIFRLCPWTYRKP
jgi:hypothetical protein